MAVYETLFRKTLQAESFSKRESISACGYRWRWENYYLHVQSVISADLFHPHPMYTWAWRSGKHALQYEPRKAMSHGKLSPNSELRLLMCMEQAMLAVRVSFGSAEETPMPCRACEPLKVAQSLGEDTHAVVTRPWWA